MDTVYGGFRSQTALSGGSLSSMFVNDKVRVELTENRYGSAIDCSINERSAKVSALIIRHLSNVMLNAVQ